MDKEKIMYNLNVYKNTVEEVLKIVNTYIKSNDKILVGGMAIDMALRKIGKKLYEDDKLPDYDFISADFFKNAYELGNILSLKYNNVSVINAFHASTMRVRVEYQEAADITYVPLKLYEKIPTLDYKGFKIVHPHYQFIDQHRALSTPFENPPNETFKGRWKKDIERHDLLYKNYPVEFKNSDVTCLNYDFNYKNHSEFMLEGYVALAYWIQQAINDGYKLKNCNLSKLSIDINKVSVKCVVPYFTCVTDDYKEFEKYKDVNYINATLDKINRRLQVSYNNNLMEVIDNKGEMKSSYKVNDNIHISNLQGVMCYLLSKAIFEKQKYGFDAYWICHDILYWASNNYKDDCEKYKKYLPTLEVYGNTNVYNSILLTKYRIQAHLDNIEIERPTPRNAYLSKGSKVKDSYFNFDIASSEVYSIDGEKRKVPFKDFSEI